MLTALYRQCKLPYVEIIDDGNVNDPFLSLIADLTGEQWFQTNSTVSDQQKRCFF